MSTLYTMVAPCFFGTESTLNFEVKRLGAQNIQVTDGRVAFQGGADVIAAANLNLRTAERVLLLLATYKTTTFDELFDGCYNIAWEDLLPANAAFPVKGSSLSSQLSSVPACQSIVKKAIVKRLMHGHKVGTLPEDGALYKVRFALRKDTVEIYLDTSGDGLHKRGYRKNATLAPIKETLAAAIADLGRVRRDSLVQDPFCGSGTLVIEAAQKALNLAPGLRRRFAAEHFDFVPADIWAEQRQKALAESKLDVGFEAFGYDIDPAAVAQANVNAKLAGVENRCHFEVADVATFAAKPEAIVLTNPPYGERLGTIEGAAKLARTLGQQMEASPCAGLYAITADMDFELHYGKRANKRRKMYNGMIPCQLYMYYNAPKTEKVAKPMPKSGFDGKRTHFEKK
jgi:putative N6-adenine-specific DNA methylase